MLARGKMLYVHMAESPSSMPVRCKMLYVQYTYATNVVTRTYGAVAGANVHFCLYNLFHLADLEWDLNDVLQNV